MSQPGTRRYYLAIDAGGTKTDLLLAEEHDVLARVRTGSIKLGSTPADIAEANLVAGLESIEQKTGVAGREITRTCIGMSGYSVPLVAAWVREQFRLRAGGELLLCGDEEIAHDAAFRGRRGVLVLAGTGSNVVGRTSGGKLLRAGGWGPVIGDEGSGYWIGLQAVRSVFRAIDEGRTTTLLPAILAAWELESIEQLIALANRNPPPAFPELTPLMLKCARAGDQIAAEVLRRAGEELARLASLVIGRMHQAEGPGFVPPDVALAGSILQSVPPVGESMVEALRRVWPQLSVALDAVDPIAGALWRARAGTP